jgi:hypothetical protein
MAAHGELRAEARRLNRELERLRVENDVLLEAAAPLIHRAPARERFAFIHRLRNRFAVKHLCRILATDRSNYYLWTRAQVRRDEREREERKLPALITEVHTAYPAYEAERITREPKCQGLEVGRRRGAGLMREHGIAGITRRKCRNLTKPDRAADVVPDLIRREFSAPMPGLKLVADISCFPTGEGWAAARAPRNAPRCAPTRALAATPNP